MRLFELILRYPKSIIVAILTITLFFAWQMQFVKMDNSVATLLPESHPSVIQDNELKQIFNSREMILIGIETKQGIFNPATLQKVKNISDGIWKISITKPEDEEKLKYWSEILGNNYENRITNILSDGIDISDRGKLSNLLIEAKDDPNIDPDFLSYLKMLRIKLSPVSDILSLAEVDNITSTDWGLSLDPPMETVPQTKLELNKLAATVFNNEMFINGLVSKDSTGTEILVEMSFYYDKYPEEAYLLFQKLEELITPYRGAERIQLAGVPIVNIYTSKYMSDDLALLTPVVILLVLIIMFFLFRNIKGALIPLSVVLVALIWTLGLMGLVGRPITLIVSAMPVMLIAIGIADGIHLFSEYKLMWIKLKNRERAILATMRQLALPVIFTSLTTMAGFASLATSSLDSIKDFGIFTSFGVFAAMIFSLTFIPAAFKLMKPPREKIINNVQQQNRLNKIFEQLANFVNRYRRWIFVSTVLLVAFSVLEIMKINVGSTMVGNFKEHSDIYQASEMLNSKFGGTEVMNIVINTNTKDGLKNTEILGKISALQDTLEARSLVGYTASLADYVKRINFVMNNNNPAYNRIPNKTEIVTETSWVTRNGKEVETKQQVEVSGKDQISQYILLYENAGGDDLQKLTDYDYSKANIVVQIRTDDTRKLREIEQVVRKYAAINFGSSAEITFAGCASLCVVADDLIIPGQTRSLGIALLVVFGLLTLIFRSPKYGLIGLLPLVLVILLAFALMSIFGVSLDAGTALVASIVLGIGVDYSVHLISRYKSLLKEGKDSNKAIHETFRTSGRAIVFNSLAVAIGFLVLLLSSFRPVIQIGWLVAVNMILSAVLTLLLVPAVLQSIDGRRKKAEAPATDDIKYVIPDKEISEQNYNVPVK